MPSKIFSLAPTVADTLSAMLPTAGYQMPPGDWVIYKILVSYGNVADATGNSGFLHIITCERTYDIAYGQGGGGATISNGSHAEPIDCAIHVPGNTILQVQVLDATAHIAEYVSVLFRPGGPTPFRTMAAGGVSANGDTVALTEESFSVSTKLTGASLTPAKDGHIYQIRFSGTSVVNAKTGAGYIRILIPNEPGPFEYAVGAGGGSATSAGPADADVINIPEGIPVHANSTIDIKIITLEAMKYPHISLSYW